MKHFHPLDTPGVRKTIGEKLGISSQAISNWKAKGEVPLEHCTAIEMATDGLVKRQELRPNDWHLIWPELVVAA